MVFDCVGEKIVFVIEFVLMVFVCEIVEMLGSVDDELDCVMCVFDFLIGGF